MIGLIDCNNFFVSCERVFNPGLRQRPVIVFSNNDGCAVALSNEAKALGIKRGEPYFKIKSICEANNIAALSGNHKLYGDMSSRVMATISSIIPDIEIYSIDEAFIHFNGYSDKELHDVGRDIVRRVRRHTGIPTSLGIAPTKTLAKVAAHFAKKHSGYRGCCIIDNDDKRRKALNLMPLRNVWGIGRRLNARFADYGISTALQFANLSKDEINNIVNISGCKTWLELNGESCIEFESDSTPQKQMICSRSFGKSIRDFDELTSIMSAFANNIGRKLRERKLCALSIGVFIHTDAFRQDQPQYYNSTCRNLIEASADTTILTETAIECLRSIFRQGYSYKKAGIMVNELTDANHIQQSLFTSAENRNRRRVLMNTLDIINSSSLSHDIIHTAAYQPIDAFTRRENPSRLFTTRLSDIISINCNNGL